MWFFKRKGPASEMQAAQLVAFERALDVLNRINIRFRPEMAEMILLSQQFNLRDNCPVTVTQFSDWVSAKDCSWAQGSFVFRAGAFTVHIIVALTEKAKTRWMPHSTTIAVETGDKVRRLSLGDGVPAKDQQILFDFTCTGEFSTQLI